MKRRPLGWTVVLGLLAVLATGAPAHAGYNYVSCNGWTFDAVWTPIASSPFGPLFRVVEFHGEANGGPVLETVLVGGQEKDASGRYHDDPDVGFARVGDVGTFFTVRGSDLNPPQNELFFISALHSPRLEINAGPPGPNGAFTCYMPLGPFPSGCL